MASVLYALVWAPAWAMRARVTARLQRRHLSADDAREDSPLAGFLYWLVEKPLFAGDFRELEPALDATGKTPLQARGHYVLRSEEHTSELQSRPHLVCRLLLEK